MDQGLQWCDTFCDLQESIDSSVGNPAGYWGAGYGGPPGCTPPLRGDCAHGGNIYFGDTGTAVTALALCHRLADATRQARYRSVLERFATFVLEGSSTPPFYKKGTAKSFLDSKTGAIGCGYYRCSSRTSDDCSKVAGPDHLNCPSRSPYTIATGTTGAAFFAQMFGLTGNETYHSVGRNSINYLLSVRW